jgi:hypothetical protein
VPDILDPLKERLLPEDEDGHGDGDVFAHKDSEEDAGQEPAVPDTFEELPIEIRSLTER